MRFEILVVDDNKLQGTTRRAILSGAGFSAGVTEDPQEALQMLSRPEVRVGLRVMITDHVMPSMQGPELVRRAREIMPELPILVISGAPEAVNAYQDYDIIFLMKPVQPDLLIHTVRSLLAATDVPRTA